jgi:uncharacterized protein YrrD
MNGYGVYLRSVLLELLGYPVPKKKKEEKINSKSDSPLLFWNNVLVGFVRKEKGVYLLQRISVGRAMSNIVATLILSSPSNFPRAWYYLELTS